MTKHHFTVDVEEYFQVSAFEPFVPRSSWDTYESRVEQSVGLLLEILSEHNALATFFVLGWIAERHPQMVLRIVQAGHEVASHGWDHRRVTHQTRAEFRDSVRASKALIEDIVGTRVRGFRAPSYSITRGRQWALRILHEEGYEYDSSLFPVSRPGYGFNGGFPTPYQIEFDHGSLLEIPPATLKCGPLRIPAAGGAYFRILPYGLVRAAIRNAQRTAIPATFYIHPWELDAAQPRIPTSRVTKLRHYTGLERTRSRLERLLQEFRFTSIEQNLTGKQIEHSHSTPG